MDNIQDTTTTTSNTFVFLVKEWNSECYKPSKVPYTPVFSTFEDAFEYVREEAEINQWKMEYDEVPDIIIKEDTEIHLVIEDEEDQYIWIEIQQIRY
jgi:hypothetical protein